MHIIIYIKQFKQTYPHSNVRLYTLERELNFKSQLEIEMFLDNKGEQIEV